MSLKLLGTGITITSAPYKDDDDDDDDDFGDEDDCGSENSALDLLY